MAAMSNYLENKLIDHVLRQQTYTPPTNVYFALYTTAPTDAGGGVEVATGGYARALLACSLANWAGTQATLSTTASSGTTGQTSNNVTVTFAVPSSSWGTVTHIGIFDALSGGNLLFWGALTASKLIQAGDAVTIQASQFVIQIDD